MRIIVHAVAAIACLAMPALSRAQPSQPPAASPYIAASAVGETRVTPDRAIVQVTVDSRAESAASAGLQNRDKQERVIAAVKVQGVAAPQIRTSAYRVNPEYAVPDRGRAPRVTGYHATNTILVEVRSIENIGKVIDAALSAGATNIGSVGLYASNTDSARREAVQLAVAKAHGEAQSAAAAAGGTLGTLVELTID
ncbi:MAG: SIMPL domain-containing protein, partial [Gemmatimonadaceae bacterium]